MTDLTVAYGGAVAVSNLSLAAPTGKITGLIGPNGAGKTSTFNAACGLVRPTHGRIILHGEDVSNLGPGARARRGLGRTFQRVELFTSQTVRENIALGRSRRYSPEPTRSATSFSPQATRPSSRQRRTRP